MLRWSATRHGATAVVASDSLIAQHVLQTARALGLSVPRDLSLVSFDDPAWMSLTDPPITVMAQPTHDIGAQAARMLIRRLTGPNEPPRSVVLEQQLIERASVAAPAAVAPGARAYSGPSDG